MATDTSTFPRLTAAQQDRRSDVLVIIVCLVALLVGWFVKLGFQNRTESYTIVVDPADQSLGSVTMSLPGSWVRAGDQPATQTLALPAMFVDPQAPSAYKTTLAADVRILEEASPDPKTTLDRYVDRAVEGHTKDLLGYQLLAEAKDSAVSGAPARVIEYAYVARPIDVQVRNAPPIVVRALDYIVVKSNRVYLVTLTGDETVFEQEGDQLRSIVNTVQLP